MDQFVDEVIPPPINIQNLNQKRAISSNHSCGPFSKDQEIRLPSAGSTKKDTYSIRERERDAEGIINSKVVVIKDIYCLKRIKRREKKNLARKKREREREREREAM